MITAEVALLSAQLLSCSLMIDKFSDVYKTTFITPLIKKAGMGIYDCCLYHLIANLLVILKLLERLAT